LPTVVSKAETPAPESGIREATPAPATETWGGVGMQEVNEKDWLTGVRQTIATQWKVPPTAVVLSPGKLRAVFVHGPPEPAAPTAAPAKKTARRPPPRRFQIVVVDNQAKKVAAFRPVTARGSDEPPKDVRFLGEEQVIYEVVAAPPPAAEPSPPPATSRAVAKAKGPKKKKASIKTKPAAARPPAGKTAHAAPKSPATTAALGTGPDGSLPPPRLFIIQSLQTHARPVRCEGHFFAFTVHSDHVAFVGGLPDAAFVAVDGEPVYPRHGRSVIPSAVAWSKDGHSLAFIETPPEGPPRLVLLAEFDNATGDTKWDLPASTSVDGARVFWAGAGRLVVGKTIGHPLFSTSFQKQSPGTP
jgi:hypothetical protein